MVEVRAEIYLAALNSIPEPLFIIDAHGKCIFMNTSFRALIGADSSHVAPFSVKEFAPNFDTGGGVGVEFVTQLKTRAEELITVKLILAPLDNKCQLGRIVSAEAGQQFHSQRLQTLGMLAGGIAHDFNNILAGVLGHISYLKNILPASGSHVESLAAIEEGGKKASVMTQQILNFSRLDAADKPVPINVNECVVKTAQLLRGAISPDYTIAWKVPPAPLFVVGVEAKVAQVIINLVINARDALSEGGLIKIELNRAQTPKPAQVNLRVSDNGAGMSKEVLDRVFEPYFTTKGQKGTGLGLATVNGIVRECGGTIKIDSEEGSGTTVSVAFPEATQSDKRSAAEADKSSQSLERGSERVLIVDDEDPVRNVLCVSLVHLGYSVDVAASGMEAISKFNEAAGGYDLVILDMLMPNISGDGVFFRLKEVKPHVKVLVISGYSSEESVQRILDNGGRGFMQKPFTIEQLAHKVRECLV